MQQGSAAMTRARGVRHIFLVFLAAALSAALMAIPAAAQAPHRLVFGAPTFFSGALT
jgi:hypothetical protein